MIFHFVVCLQEQHPPTPKLSCQPTKLTDHSRCNDSPHAGLWSPELAAPSPRVQMQLEVYDLQRERSVTDKLEEPKLMKKSDLF